MHVDTKNKYNHIKPRKINILRGVKSQIKKRKEVGFKKSFKMRQRRGLSNVQWQTIPKLWSCNGKCSVPRELKPSWSADLRDRLGL